MSDDDDAASAGGPEEMYSLDQCLERFVGEVDSLTRDQQANARRLESQLRSQFLALRRDLRLQFARELDGLRAEVRTTVRFAPFRRLPPEVRTRIWVLALPPARVLELRNSFLSRPLSSAGPVQRFPAPGPATTSSRLPPPALAHVCHEARQIALRHGRLCRTKVVEEQLPPVWGRPLTGPPPPPGAGAMGTSLPTTLYATGWTWFDPERDWLKLQAHGPMLPPALSAADAEALFEVAGVAENVLVRRPAASAEFERVVERVGFGAFPELRQLGIVASHELVAPRRSMAVETRLFGDGPFAFVDMRCQGDVDRVAAIFASDPAERKAAGRWAEHAAALRSGRPWTSRFVAWSSTRDEELMVAWIRAKHRRSPVTVNLGALIDPEDSLFEDEDHPWVQAELRAMPTVRVLHLFILDDPDGRDLKRLYGTSWAWRLNTIAVC